MNFNDVNFNLADWFNSTDNMGSYNEMSKLQALIDAMCAEEDSEKAEHLYGMLSEFLGMCALTGVKARTSMMALEEGAKLPPEDIERLNAGDFASLKTDTVVAVMDCEETGLSYMPLFTSKEEDEFASDELGVYPAMMEIGSMLMYANSIEGFGGIMINPFTDGIEISSDVIAIIISFLKSVNAIE